MNRQSGLGLIEVLIALVVISVGLLGIASLQAASISRAHNSDIQGLAAIEAQNIIAAMLANPKAVPAGTATVEYLLAEGGAFPTGVKDCAANVCTPKEMAQYDLQEWGKQIQRNLPSGDGWIECPKNDPLRCRVTVSWQEKKLDPSSANANAQTETREYSLVVQL